MSRRSRLAAAAVAWLVSLGGCRSEVIEDPVYAHSLPGPQAVDGRFDRLIFGDRRPARYDEHHPVRGAAEPLVTIVEYSDFACPFCGQFAHTLDELLRAYPDDIRLVFKQFPLPMHPRAPLAAQAALAAGEQRRFWAMHDRLFDHVGQLERADLLGHARALDLDLSAFTAALDSVDTASRVEQDRRSGLALGVRGTPTTFVNGRPVPGMPEGETLIALIEQERRLAADLLAAGCQRPEIYARILRAAGATGPNPGPAEVPVP